MATHSSLLAWGIPWTGAWWATGRGVARSWSRLKQGGTDAHRVREVRLQFPQSPDSRGLHPGRKGGRRSITKY